MIDVYFIGEVWAGVDIANEDIANNFEKFVWEPALVKSNAITAAIEAACLILSVDETIKNPESKNPVDETPLGPGGRSLPPGAQQKM